MTAALNFAFDLAVLWAAGRLRAFPVSPGRLALGAAAGTAYFLVVPTHGRPPSVAASLALASCLMVALAFRVRTLRALWGLLSAFYAVVCVAGGAGVLAAGVLAGPAGPDPLGGAVISLLVIAAVGALGARASGRMSLVQALRLQLSLHFGTRRLSVSGMVDTGNRLREPVGRLAVVLVDVEALGEVVPAGLMPLLRELAGGALAGAGRLAELDPEWGARFRLVPFRSIGTDHGLLAGFRADRLEVVGPNRRRVVTGPVVVALAPTPLLAETGFQALVPPDCLVEAPAGVDRPAAEPTQAALRGGSLGAATG